MSNQNKEELGGGGNYVEMQSKQYDLALNVLIGVRRGLGDLNVVGKEIDDEEYKSIVTTRTRWVSTSKMPRESTYKFTEYAPQIF